MARLITPALLGLLLATFLLSLAVGSTSVAVLPGLYGFLTGEVGLDAIVIGEIRLPRTLIALCVGAALGLSGAALQGLLRNPLAEPSLTGASQGAALGAASVFYFGLFPQLGAAAPGVAGLIGAAVALTLMLMLAGSARSHMVIMAGLAISKAGVPGKDIDGAARKVITDAGYGEYFGHGYGHSLGLEVHENPSPNARNDKPMPVGAVASAEPGIYLPGKFGVRIEDTCVFLEDGIENLTHSPKNLIII